MKPIVKEWLVELLDNAIEEAKGTIANEKIWADGSTDDESITMHNENVEANEEYIEVLESIKNEL